MTFVVFKINGVPYDQNLASLPADITLNTFIRQYAQLTATKFMCLEGGCGACICVVKGHHPFTGEEKTWAVNSCLTLLNTCLNWDIITCEGLGDRRVGYHPIQKRLAKMNGTQCGFCSPGFVMNMYGLLESKDRKVTMTEVEDSFGGNICRCTGYRPILDAMKSFAVDSNIEIPPECLDNDIEDLNFPLKCMRFAKNCSSARQTVFRKLAYADGSQWYWPTTLAGVFEALETVDTDQYILVNGNTAHGVYRRPETITHFIDLNAVGELKQHSIGSDKLVLGANLSLTETMNIFLEASKRNGFEYCQQLWNHFDVIANVPVRNAGTLAGNIATKKAHPEFPSDVFLTFEALNVQVVINEDINTQIVISLSKFLAKQQSKFVIRAFELRPYPKDTFKFGSYKITPRAQNAHAFVNAAFLLNMDSANNGDVQDARICFGGLSPTFVHATSTESILQSNNLYEPATLRKIFGDLMTSIEPNEVLPDPSPDYRKFVACGLFYKFLLRIAPDGMVKDVFKSGAETLQRPLSSGLQTFDTNETNYPVTKPTNKLEGLIQCAGEAKYMNDVLTTANTVFCAFVTATKVGSTIEDIDPSKALELPGVIAFYEAKDIPGVNSVFDPVMGYEIEEIFCSDRVKNYDQPIGVIVAENSDTARRAATKVMVTYSNEEYTVLPTFAAVLEANQLKNRSCEMYSWSTEYGVIVEDLYTDIKGKGLFDLGPQYHFTMEPQTTVAIPVENGLQIYSATQWIDHTQSVIAKMLQVSVNSVQFIIRRLGGGYGSRISRANQVACTAALVATKLNRPSRFVQSIESMLVSNGKRWACHSDYSFHTNSNGKILQLTYLFYEDGGCSLNENPVGYHTAICVRNCYDFSATNSKFQGFAVLTDAPSASWCRAPGSVEGIAMMEQIIEHIAFEANIDPIKVRLANIKSNNKLTQLIPTFVDSTEYYRRRKDIDDFNEKNRWRKRGLGVAIMEYPVFYKGIFTATVAIYHIDGTVVISHGGIEMGQGLNTKVAQVAAHVLAIPIEMIKIESTDSINGANCMVTGGSIGSESVCYAVHKACSTLNLRLKAVKESLPKDHTWQNVVHAAWQKDINMIVSDYYKAGDLRKYNVYGLGLTEVEIDVLTGNSQIRRVDILEDTGESLNPFIDVGQIEGGFVMMLGYWLTEALVYNRQTGQLVTNRTWNYKVPGAKDIPIDFRVQLIQKNPNPAGFMRSKATGEPPCCLAVSIIFALQHAIQSARKDAGLPREWVRLGAPTTPETILLSCGTDIESFALAK